MSLQRWLSAFNKNMSEMMHGESGRSEAKQSEPTVAETNVWGEIETVQL